MKLDKFLIITVGALVAVLLILLAMGGAAFLCLYATQGPVTNDGALMQKSYDYNGSLSGIDKVYLQGVNINGNIVVKEGDGDAYSIDVNTHGTDRDYQRYNVDFTQSVSNGVKTLRVEIKDTKEPKAYNSRYTSDITITVPKSKTYDMDLVTVNGNVEMGEFNCGIVTVAGVNCAISSKAGAANATYVTVNGNIDVKSAATKGKISLNTVNGAITVSIPKDTPLSLNAYLMNGGISNSIPIDVTEKGRMSLVGKTAGFTDGIFIETALVNGNIDIKTH
jgi:DUF4097 and DUF4098 domain-containing protein YvlB